MNKELLFAAVAATLFAAPVHAVKINDYALTANGGSMDNIQGTAPNVFDSLRTASNASQFNAVGRIGGCTGTWLGTEGEYAWVLTAARCVANTHLVQAADHLTFTNKNGVALAGGAGSTSFIHAYRITKPSSSVRDAGTDIALVRMKRLPASDTSAPAAPVLHDGTAEAGAPVAFVSYGSAKVNNQSVNSVWPTTGDRRAWGESMLTAVNEMGHALVSHFTTGSATNWAGVERSDAGSPWFQQRDGQWQIVGATSSGSVVQSNGVRISKYASWINDLFPGATLSSEVSMAKEVELTETRGHDSINFGRGISLIKVPGQPELIASATAITVGNEASLPRTITVPLTNGKTTTPVVVRAWRSPGQCINLTIHNNANCGQMHVSTFHFRYVASDNPGLLPGTWTGRIVFDARHWLGAIVGRAEIDIAIKVAGEVVTPGFEFGTKNYGLYATSPSVYYTVPTPSVAAGPTAGFTSSTLGHSVITVQARDAVTNALTLLKLRAQRDNGCDLIAMNNARMCQGNLVSKLKIWFDPSDNPALQPSRYRAQFDVQARGWHDKAFNETFPVDVDLNLMQ